MCSQLFTLLLLALSLTLASCLEPEQTTTYIASTAPSEETSKYPKHIQVHFVTKSLHDLVVDNRKLAAESKDGLQKVQQRLDGVDTSLSSQAAESKNLSNGLKEVKESLSGVNTRLTSQAAESKNFSNGLQEVLQRVIGVETRLTSQAAESKDGLQKVLQRLDGGDTRLSSLAAESKNLSNGLKEVLQRVGGVDTRLTSQEKATNILFQQKETVFTVINDSKKNWYEAFADCRRRGLDLASIENEKEYQIIYRQIQDIGDTKRNISFWLSATDLIHEHTYVWMSTGHNVGFTKWALGEPNKLSPMGEHCVELQYLNNHKMNDVNCDYTKNYICESRNNKNPKMSEQRSKAFTVFTGNKLNWYEALIDCKKQGLRLATVESQEEQEEVIKSIKWQGLPDGKLNVFWLSGLDLGGTNNYVWMTSGQPFNYTAWYSDAKGVKEPNYDLIGGGKERCLSLKSGYGYKWTDDIWSIKNYYICDNQA